MAERRARAIVAATNARTANGTLYEAGAFFWPIWRCVAEDAWPPLYYGHEKRARVGQVTDLSELAPGHPDLPAEFIRRGWGALVAALQFDQSELGLEAWRHRAQLRYSIAATWRFKHMFFDAEDTRHIRKCRDLLEVSMTYTPSNPGTGRIIHQEFS